QRPLTAAICEYCDWQYLLTQDEELPICPHCYREQLVALAEADAEVDRAPELVLPFSVATSSLENSLANFSSSFRFSPRDLQGKILVRRMRPVFIPAWLVDSDVLAAWQAEAGYDYQVVSHQESYVADSWQTREVKETKIRWEARAGRLQRHYSNVRAPALEEIDEIRASLGTFASEDAQAYQPQMLEDGLVRLPNRDRQDAWPDTHPVFKKRAAEECRLASRADHIRQFKWQAQYANQHWSLLLLPVYSTWYYDDDGQPLPVLLNGRTGQLAGIMRASMKQAKRATTMIAVLAVLFFLLTLVLLLLGSSLVLPVAVLAFAAGIAAIWPIAYVSRFNRERAADNLVVNSGAGKI
ncbi:MAG: hypothetical protein R3293_23570, partial [Candidatus Promineifilaceae bacterium]|nr:hypothetical protein [Candidatus Promineifilaceae bacterium]